MKTSLYWGGGHALGKGKSLLGEMSFTAPKCCWETWPHTACWSVERIPPGVCASTMQKASGLPCAFALAGPMPLAVSSLLCTRLGLRKYHHFEEDPFLLQKREQQGSEPQSPSLAMRLKFAALTAAHAAQRRGERARSGGGGVHGADG